MTRQRTEMDLEITLRGKGLTKGTLDPDDLQALADLFKGLRAYDSSLKNIRMFGTIRKGSSKVSAMAPVEMDMFDTNPARQALQLFFGEVFDPLIGWLWNKPARLSLEKIVDRKRTMSVLVMPANGDELPLRKKFTKKEYEQYSQKIAEEPEWRSICGKILEVDINDRTFEIHTAKGYITCKFPEDSTDEYILSLVKMVVSAEVFCRNKPSVGSWKADKCQKLLLAPSQDSIIKDIVFPIGIKPPKNLLVNGFNLQEFAPSLDEDAGENLATFLREFKG
ncbi:MAG: hypothetical protein FWF98_05075 [Dehalococcoidia bacterium]|nr:hypothetical protein [Dehalococcoidia bacterium]